MSKVSRFIFSAYFIGVAALDSHYGLDFITIPIAILAIILLGSILKEELGI